MNVPEIELAADISYDTEWHVAVFMEPGEVLGLSAEFANDLAKCHKGELVIVCVANEDDDEEIALARKTLNDGFQRAFEDKFSVAHLVLLPIDHHQITRELTQFVIQADIGLVIVRWDGKLAPHVRRLPCDVGIMRGTYEQLDQAPVTMSIDRILVPTAGGPNTAAAFELLLPMCSDRDVTAIYVANSEEGQLARTYGHQVLKETLEAADAHQVVHRKVVASPRPMQGILNEIETGYDLVILGANEDTFDRILSGDVVAETVRKTRTPVLIMRRYKRAAQNVFSAIDWQIRRLIPHLDKEARDATYARIRQNSRAEVSFYVLIALSSAIASFGLLQSSPAVVIGAMLVAPLMSPIVGVGMAMVFGEEDFLKMSLSSVIRGVILAIIVGCLIGTFGLLVGILEFGGTLPSEVDARTQPNLLDLGVALFSGMAGAYALCYSQAAGALPGVAIAAALVPPLASVGIAAVTGHPTKSLGALLLFVTNLVTIASASAVTFFLVGFRLSSTNRAGRIVTNRTFRIAVVALLINAAVLGYTTYALVTSNGRDAEIQTTVEAVLEEVGVSQNEISLISDIDVSADPDDTTLARIGFTVQAPRPMTPQEASLIQTSLAENADFGTNLRQINRNFEDVVLDMTVLQVRKLEPEEIEEVPEEGGIPVEDVEE